MSVPLLAALWAHLLACVVLVGSFGVVLLAGVPPTPTARRWDASLVRAGHMVVVLGIGCGIAWLMTRTTMLENRSHAALEVRAVMHVMLDTWPGLVWLARHAVLLVLGAFLVLTADAMERPNWIAARGEAFVLAALALALVTASSHAAAVAPGRALAIAADVAHLLATGVWLGGLGAVALLLRRASAESGADARPYAVRTARRFSHAALIAMVILIVSGVVNARAQVENVAALLGTPHGHLLLAKLVVLVAILAIAIVNRTRLLPAAASPDAVARLAAFVALEATLALGLLALAASMTLTTPARHAPPVWPLPFRLAPEIVFDVTLARWRVLVGSQLVVVGTIALLVSFLLRRRRRKLLTVALVLIVIGAGIGLPPIVVDAYPTSYARPPLIYHAGSIASGAVIYRDHCAGCHETTESQAPLAPDLRSPAIARRHAGELYWLISHGTGDMPRFDARLREAQRWDVINYLRALGAADDARLLGGSVEPGRAWLVAPDFTIAVGPLSPTALRDYRGRRMVLLVLYTLPGSRARMTELARMYDALWVMGVEIIAVPMHGPRDAIAELGASPAVLFPVVTEGATDIVTTYRMFAAGRHAELLIDRQGYIRAIWEDGSGAIGAQVEALNAEKSPPPFPDDHVH